MKKVVVSLLLSSISILSYAQNQPTHTKKGFLFGTSLGVASSMHSFPGKSQNNVDFGFDFKVGYWLKPQLALLLTSNVSAYEYSGIGRTRKRDFGVLAPSIQYWFKERFWILGGLGLGLDAPVFFDIQDPDIHKEETKYYTGFGLVGAIGYDIYRSERFTLDLKARVTYRNVNMPEGKTQGISPSLLIGINFQ